MEEENETKKAKDVLNLLVQLAELQAVNAKLRTAINVRSATKNIENKVNNLSSSIINSGKAFGLSAKKVREEYLDRRGILKNYKESLKEAKKSWSLKLTDCEKEIQKLECDEQALYIKLNDLDKQKNRLKRTPEYKRWAKTIDEITKQLSKDVKSESTEMNNDLIKQLKTLKDNNPLKDIEAEISKIKKELETKVNDIGQKKIDYETMRKDRDGALKDLIAQKSMVPKQNIIKRIFGSILSKINGANNFSKNVIEKVENEIEEGRKKMAESVNSKIEKTSETIGNVIQQGKDRKQQLLNSAIEKLNDKLEKANQKNQDLEDKYFGGPEEK